MLTSPLSLSPSPFLSLNSISLSPPHRPWTLSRTLYPSLVNSHTWLGRYGLLQTLGETGEDDGGETMWSGRGHSVVREAYGSVSHLCALPSPTEADSPVDRPAVRPQFRRFRFSKRWADPPSGAGVNAMDWEEGGQERLATGGDDTKCVAFQTRFSLFFLPSSPFLVPSYTLLSLTRQRLTILPMFRAESASGNLVLIVLRLTTERRWFRRR
jgi:hypothetical protein